MSKGSNVTALENVLGDEQSAQVIGGAANDFWHWRKRVEENPNSGGSVMVPRVGWEVSVG